MTARIATRPDRLIVGEQETRIRPQAALLLWSLMGHTVVTPDIASETLWPGNLRRPDAWRQVVRSYLWAIRRGLAGSGWSVQTLGYQGWSLTRG